MMRPFIFALMMALHLGSPLAQAAPHAQTLPTRGESPVPAELQQLAKDFNAAMRSRDLDKANSFYSQRYMHDGRNYEKHRDFLAMVMATGTSQYELKFTRFAAIDDERAYIEAVIELGYTTANKEFNYQMVKENGQWKWLGNQKP